MLDLEAKSDTDLNPRRPPPKFAFGQSVHHFWASWMSTAKENQVPKQLAKKGRPAWYSACINQEPTWGQCVYAGLPYTGWLYVAH